MTAKIFTFPDKEMDKERKIDDIVDNKLKHPDPDVLRLWRERVKSIFRNYQQEPYTFTVNVPEDVNDAQLEQITLSIENTLSHYQHHINKQKYAMLNDLCMLECRICELELEQKHPVRD